MVDCCKNGIEAVGDRHGDDVFLCEKEPKRACDGMCDMTSKMLFPPPPPHIAALYRHKGKR